MKNVNLKKTNRQQQQQQPQATICEANEKSKLLKTQTYRIFIFICIVGFETGFALPRSPYPLPLTSLQLPQCDVAHP